MEKDVYQENGYENRKDYLKNLADQFGIPYREVALIASMLGKDEDFDGLICELEDYEIMGEY